MDDWENDMTTNTIEDTNLVKKEDKVKESEDYVKPVYIKPVKEEKVKNPEDEIGGKWEIQNKARELKKKQAELAEEGLDERTKQIRREQRTALEDADDFMGGSKTSNINLNTLKEEKPFTLKIEKDFIELATVNVAKIKEAKLPSKLSLSYLKHSIDLLGPSLDSEKIDNLIKGLTVMFNQKRKEENEKAGKQKKIKYVQKGGKAQDQISSLSENKYDKDDYGDEDFEDDDFM